jgi:hypothetical protein
MRYFLRPIAGAALFAATPVFAADSLCPQTGETKQTGAAPVPEWPVSSCRVTYNRDAGLPSGLPAIRSIVCR